MAKLPDPMQMARAAPRSVMQVVSPGKPTEPVSAGAASGVLGGGLASSGKMLKDVVQQEAQFEAARAKADLLSFRVMLDEKMKERKDWRNLETEYNQAMDEEMKRLSESLQGNEYARQAFVESALPLVSEGQARVAQYAFTAQRDENRAAALERLDKLQKIVQGTDDPTIAAEARKTASDLVKSNPQWFDRQEALRLEKEFLKGGVLGRVEVVAEKDPLAAVRLLDTPAAKEALTPAEIVQAREKLQLQMKQKAEDHIKQWALDQARAMVAKGLPLEKAYEEANKVKDAKERDALVRRVSELYSQKDKLETHFSAKVYEQFFPKVGKRDESGKVIAPEDIPSSIRAQMKPEHLSALEQVYQQRVRGVGVPYNFIMGKEVRDLLAEGKTDKARNLVMKSMGLMPEQQRVALWNAVEKGEVPPELDTGVKDDEAILYTARRLAGEAWEKDDERVWQVKDELYRWRLNYQRLHNGREPDDGERDKFLQAAFRKWSFKRPDSLFFHGSLDEKQWYEMSTEDKRDFFLDLKAKDPKLYDTLAAVYAAKGADPTSLDFVAEFNRRLRRKQIGLEQ